MFVKHRSSHRRCSVRKCVLRNFCKFTGNHLCHSPFLNKVAGLRPAILLKKGLWHRRFLVNFVKFLRIRLLQNTSRRLLLKTEIWLFVCTLAILLFKWEFGYLTVPPHTGRSQFLLCWQKMILSYIFINHPWILPNVVSWKSEKLQNSFVNKVKCTGIHHITDGFFWW